MLLLGLFTDFPDQVFELCPILLIQPHVYIVKFQSIEILVIRRDLVNVLDISQELIPLFLKKINCGSFFKKKYYF